MTASLSASTSALPPAACAKPWGAGSGVTRTEVLHGLPIGGMDLALANGKRHVPAPAHDGRTRAETLHGFPLSGRGADLAALGGRQKFGPPPPVVRSKIEALHGLPTRGRGADIALAGGRQHFPARSGSAPPEPCNETVRDLQLLESRQSCGRLPAKKGSGASSPAAGGAESPRRRSTASACASAATSPCSNAVASPIKAGAASPRTGGSPRAGGSPRLGGCGASPKASVARRLSGSSPKVCSPSRRKLSGGGQQPPISEEDDSAVPCQDRFGAFSDAGPDGACGSFYSEDTLHRCESSLSTQDPSTASLGCSPGSLVGSASLASLTSELSQCMHLCNSVKSMARTASTGELSQCMQLCTSVKSMARTASTASMAAPDGASMLTTAADDAVRSKMEVAWQAVCTKLRMPYEPPSPQAAALTSPPRSPRVGPPPQTKNSAGLGSPTAALSAAARRAAQVHPFRSGPAGSSKVFSAR